MDTITLDASSLFHKWGFDDGDLLGGVLLEGGYDPVGRPRCAHLSFDHEVLARCVEGHLLPVLPIKVEVERIGTCHNPIRATAADMNKADAVKGVSVEVSALTVLEIAAEVLREFQVPASD